jgi:hypothetical protein
MVENGGAWKKKTVLVDGKHDRSGERNGKKSGKQDGSGKRN